MLRALALVLFVAACAGKSTAEPARPASPARPPSITDEMVATADHLVATITKMATDVDTAVDCSAATAALLEHDDALRSIRPAADRLEKQLSSADADTKRWLQDTYSSRLSNSSAKMLRKMDACAGDEAFKAAVQAVISHQ